MSNIWDDEEYMFGDRDVSIDELMGKVLTQIDGAEGDGVLRFTTSDNEVFTFYHRQGCCENVTIEDICGDMQDLIGSPLLMADEVVTEGENPEGIPPRDYQESWTWTFYKFATIKGSVTVRWYGESNGYYSERVSLIREKAK